MIARSQLASACMAAALLAAPAHAQTFETAMAGLAQSLERAVSGLRIDTRQHSLDGQQLSNSATASNMALSNVVVEMEQNVALRDAVARYESMQNDINGLCAAVAAQRNVSTASDATSSASASLDEYERNWLAVGGDRSQTLAQTQRIRRTAFCTDSELEAGLCLPEASRSMGGMPAGDSAADAWLLRREYGTAEAQYGTIFMDTIAPFPTIETQEEASGSVQGLLNRAAARREMALIAIARGGFTDVLMRGLEGGLEQ
ncbi:hypothetical protein [Hyphomicrobium sp.]|uniref:hypothetical protein n=1 Tax=Hyphomicrobium sp. TaxID=82 RepID=UPI002FE3330E